jgi:hypothetical protein
MLRRLTAEHFSHQVGFQPVVNSGALFEGFVKTHRKRGCATTPKCRHATKSESFTLEPIPLELGVINYYVAF